MSKPSRPSQSEDQKKMEEMQRQDMEKKLEDEKKALERERQDMEKKALGRRSLLGGSYLGSAEGGDTLGG